MKKLSRIASPLLTVLLLASPAYAAANATDSSQDLTTLKAQITKLSAKVDQLETQAKKAKKTEAAAPVAAPVAAPAPVAAAAPAADVVTKGSFPGSIKLPGTETSFKIGGYIKADMINDIGQSYDRGFSTFNAIPLNNTIQKDRSFDTNFSAKQSRFNLETRTNTSLGELKTFAEVDFYGTGTINNNLNGYSPQLRLAYGSVAGFTAGQNWSNFMDTTAASESLDYLGSAGRVFVRQGQIAYAHDFGPVKASASIEGRIMNDAGLSAAPGSNFTTIGSGAAGTGRTTMPDVTLRGDYKYASDGYVSLRSLFVVNNVDHTTGTADNHDANNFCYGFGLSGKQGTFGKDAVLYDLNYGKGTGRYLFDVGSDGNYYNSTKGKLYAAQYFDATAGYQHYWSDEFRSNLFGGYLHKVNNLQEAGWVATATGVNKDVASAHANLIWQPAPAYKVGLEYMRGYRKVEGITAGNKTDGNLNRVVTSFIYSF